MMNELSHKKMFKVLTPIPEKDGNGTKFWMRLGSAFEGKGGALNVYLDALPTHKMMLHIREMDEKDFEKKNNSHNNRDTGTNVPDDMPF